MSDLYDLEADGGWTSRPPQSVDEEWRAAYMPRRSAQVAKYRAGAQPQLNPVNGHAIDCACNRCPGWYEARARMAVAAQAFSEPVVPPRAPRPLMDVVLPVSVLMMVFSLCAMIVLPVVTPLVMMSALGMGLMAICVAVVAVVALLLVGAVRRTAREAAPTRVVRGRVLRRR
ncbi:membrane protein [Streptomyces phage Galactica]|nr:membrane protein [Streptomyces phage Galactica]